ncbi:MAG: hypothetical protein ACYTFI_15155 [Planctomycetota bacterium]
MNEAVTPETARDLLSAYRDGKSNVSADDVANALVASACQTKPDLEFERLMEQTFEANPKRGRPLCMKVCAGLQRRFKERRFSLVPNEEERRERYVLGTLWSTAARLLLEDRVEEEFAAKLVLEAAAERYSDLWLPALRLMAANPSERFREFVVRRHGNFDVCHDSYHTVRTQALAANGGAEGAKMISSRARQEDGPGRAARFVRFLRFVEDEQALRELLAFLVDRRPSVRTAARETIQEVTGEVFAAEPETAGGYQALSARLRERFFGDGVRLKVFRRRNRNGDLLGRFEILKNAGSEQQGTGLRGTQRSITP